MTKTVSDVHFISHERQYEITSSGAIHQLDAKPYVYDAKYISTYDTPAYKKNAELLQALRLGFVIGAHGSTPDSILDFGYGNGAFMEMARKKVDRVFGFDLPETPVPEGCIKADNYNQRVDVVTFWDALEHTRSPDLIIKDLPCTTICISLPYCHYHSKGKEWFDEDYRHRKPDEHIWHFNLNSLERFFNSNGWKMISYSRHEDIVRQNPKEDWNILAAAFKRF